MWKAVLQIAVATVILLHAAHGKCMLHAILFCIQYYSAMEQIVIFLHSVYITVQAIRLFAFSITVQEIVSNIFAFDSALIFACQHYHHACTIVLL